MSDYKKEMVARWFEDDINLLNDVKLTEAEINFLQKFEYSVLVANGLKNINGGFSNLVIYEMTEIDTDNCIDIPALKIKVECGSADEEGSNISKWEVIFNRKTCTIEQD